MTKEELEKEAEDYANKSYGNDAFTQAHIPQMIEPVRMYLKQAYLAGAEPREKQIQVLSKRCLQLQQDKGELIDETRELEAQIEKMKCGQNCKHSYLYQEDRKCQFTYCDCINCKDKWELRR